MTTNGPTRSSLAPLHWIALAVTFAATVFLIVEVFREATSVMAALNAAAFGGLALLFAGVGVLIDARQPGNRIGLLLLVIAGGLLMSGLSDFYSARLETAPETLTPWLFLFLWVSGSMWAAFVFPILALLYVFPTGHLISRRWRWAPWLMIVEIAVLLGLFIVQTEVGPSESEWTVENPIGFIDPDTLSPLFGPFQAGILVLAIGGLIAMVLRYRRGSYEERAQIKLVLVSVIVMTAGFAALLLNEAWTDTSSPVALLLPIGFGGIPVAIAMAILKHGLFDIDLVISRSLTFGALAVFIGAVYVGIVVGIGEIFGAGGDANFGLSIAATTVVALAFQPVRRRVEHAANRLVYGKRATPYEVLAGFSQRAAEMSDEELLDRIPQFIVDGTGASEAAVWVRSGNRFRTASSWPDAALARTIEGSDTFSDPEADFALPIYHDGECLGGVSLVKARGETTRPADVELLEGLADGMGLALRNIELTDRLRQQVRDLKRSRDRVLNAADDARRSLEHDLDSGPQQQLVAVKVKLGPTRVLAVQQGAEKTAAVLEDIERQAGEAIQAIRDFAGGIYPPLLEAEGLAAALNYQTRRAAIPVALNPNGVGRYPRTVESAVYFSILEALQNAAKHAEATSAEVELTERDGTLRFSVTDNGQGFDTTTTNHGAGLNGIADRLDTVGGTWEINSTPGSGTTVSGSVPIRDHVPAT